MKTYKFTFQGKEFTRKTDRTYSHAVVISDDKPGVMCWVGRPDLLAAAIKQATSKYGYPPSIVHAITLEQPA